MIISFRGGERTYEKLAQLGGGDVWSKVLEWVDIGESNLYKMALTVTLTYKKMPSRTF